LCPKPVEIKPSPAGLAVDEQTVQHNKKDLGYL